ncbi:MAG: tetratricopeptide repeat protein [Defluviitaleaceae bacterium]|nr:tetratricopeptide repeat protein [Defluviitaleaceae bacterium]
MSAITLLPCVSQAENAAPYQFKTTGQRVFSLEEALFHVFQDWKQTVEDFCCEELAAWVNDSLGLPFHAAKIRRLAGIESFTQRMTEFLTLTDYFDRSELYSLRGELESWEKRMEWERLKERGDCAFASGEPSKAAALYKRALACERNPRILNNIGVALMRLELYGEAMAYLEEAIKTEAAAVAPARMYLNYAEAAIYAHSFEIAEQTLKNAGQSAEPHEIHYLNGELNFEAGKLAEAAEFFEKAAAQKPEKRYIYRMAEVYAKMQNHAKAEAALRAVADKDAEYYMKLAEVKAAGGDLAGAAEAIERALASEPENVRLWTRLAAYYRRNMDLQKAQSAIIKALAIDPEDDRARLEQARIKKDEGKGREYLAILHNMLKEFKGKYRETYGEIN